MKQLGRGEFLQSVGMTALAVGMGDFDGGDDIFPQKSSISCVSAMPPTGEPERLRRTASGLAEEDTPGRWGDSGRGRHPDSIVGAAW